MTIPCNTSFYHSAKHLKKTGFSISDICERHNNQDRTQD